MIRIIGWFLNLILPSWVAGITLAPFGIYVRRKHIGNYKIITHERVHWYQQREMLFIFFYLWYFIEYLIKRFKYGKKAYKNLSFEREANFGEDKDYYATDRKPYSWIHYL